VAESEKASAEGLHEFRLEKLMCEARIAQDDPAGVSQHADSQGRGENSRVANGKRSVREFDFHRSRLTVVAVSDSVDKEFMNRQRRLQPEGLHRSTEISIAHQEETLR
jgi:hypothetical protein